MKKVIIVGLLFVLLGATSCNSFLEENPRSQLSSETFFSSPNDAYSAVNRLYRKGVPGLYSAGIYNGATILHGGYLSGLFDNDYKGQEQFIQHCHDLSLDPVKDNSQLQTMWRDPYEVIVRNCNFAILGIPSCPGLTDKERAQLMAESRFFRALNYFYLVKTFGPVPLITTYFASMDQNLFIPRSSEKLIYDLIVADLEDALKGGLAEKPMPSNGFRVSQASVAALLADVYLNMAGSPVNDATKYAKAAEIAKTYLLDAKFQGTYALIQNIDQAGRSAYNTLRTSDNEKEYLYSIEYNYSITNAGPRPAWCFPIDAATWGEFRYDITNPAYNPTQTLHAAYDQVNDLRYQERQYFHTTYTQVREPNVGRVHNLGRLPFFWYEEDALLNTARAIKDQVHYRLAEVYLITAEAVAMSEGVAGAVQYLAPIKARASLNKTQAEIEAELSALSRENFVREVWAEKIRELIFENKIWNDITRTRMYPNVVGSTFTFVPVIGARNDFGSVFTEKDLLFPIPDQETQRNPALRDAVLQ